jgi:hypothetical protein
MPYEICEILSQKHICRLCDGKSELIMGRGDVSHTYNLCSKWAGIFRYATPELSFVPEFHTGPYQNIGYYIHLIR